MKSQGLLQKNLNFVCSLLCLLALTPPFVAFAEDLDTNGAHVTHPPSWLTESRVDRVFDRIQNVLEWDVRKISVIWYGDESAFERAHGLGSSVRAFTRPSENTVHLGPQLNASNFDGIFGHELVHVILYQKYKGAVPSWLEEGLANYAGKIGKVDYSWLASQPPRDVRTLSHPFKGLTARGNNIPFPKYHYMASTALIEMIASHCDLEELLQLSVGKSLETYLSTFCGIEDVNTAFNQWLQRKRATKGHMPKDPSLKIEPRSQEDS